MSKRKIIYPFLCSTLILYTAVAVYFGYVALWNDGLTKYEIKWLVTDLLTLLLTLPLCAIAEPNK